ncbi:MAG TPA: nuclear transport factor 2 family protein, partial [Terriglobales bacterium]
RSDLSLSGSTSLGPTFDYVEGWYEGSAERMGRALHPNLAKRIVSKTPKTRKDRLDEMIAKGLVRYTQRGGGTKTPRKRQQKDVTIFDIYNDEASAKLTFLKWVGFLHLARFNGRWVIVNVLWQYKRKPSPG